MSRLKIKNAEVLEINWTFYSPASLCLLDLEMFGDFHTFATRMVAVRKCLRINTDAKRVN